MKIRKLGDKKPKVVIFNGSPRRENSCAGQDSKTKKIIDWVIDQYLPFIDFDYIDLSPGSVNIQPCKGCISTSNGFHCHWKCTCYRKGSDKLPDLMYEADIYDRLEKCDAFIVFSPIHWYAVTTSVKAMFDRLVCANQTLTQEDAELIMGYGNIKNTKLTSEMELSGKYRDMLKNHLSGKIAAFYIHGDDGANDYDGKQPNIGDKEWDVKNCIMPLVYQCRYSGIICPDDLIEAFYINKGKPYSQANLELFDQYEFFDRATQLIENLLKRF